jgi:hypothetical protein
VNSKANQHLHNDELCTDVVLSYAAKLATVTPSFTMRAYFQLSQWNILGNNKHTLIWKTAQLRTALMQYYAWMEISHSFFEIPNPFQQRGEGRQEQEKSPTFTI